MRSPITELPIDIVDLWVDGNDPVWRAKRHQAAMRMGTAEAQALPPYGNVEGRFRDKHQLCYSLRASSHMTLVSHQDLLPADRLPTFDSGNIETYIHRIPGLSERYFYLDDDVFFGAPVQLDHWFWPGGVYAAWSDDPEVSEGPMRPGDNSQENASRLSGEWLNGLPSLESGDYQHTPRTFAHSPRPMLKSLLFQLEAEAPELFERVRSSVFRAWDNPTLVSDFVLRWALAHGVAKIRAYAHLYVATGDIDQSDQLAALVQSDGELDFFCVNDTTDDAHGHDPRLAQVKASLKSLFPQASLFEIPQSPSAVAAVHQCAPHIRVRPLREPEPSGHGARRSGSRTLTRCRWILDAGRGQTSRRPEL